MSCKPTLHMRKTWEKHEKNKRFPWTERIKNADMWPQCMQKKKASLSQYLDECPSAQQMHKRFSQGEKSFMFQWFFVKLFPLFDCAAVPSGKQEIPLMCNGTSAIWGWRKQVKKLVFLQRVRVCCCKPPGCLTASGFWWMSNFPVLTWCLCRSLSSVQSFQCDSS